MIHNLKKEHRALDKLWDTLATELKSLPENGFSEAFVTAAREFCRLNREHVAVENKDLLPVAAGILSNQDLGAVGETMAARRGVRYSAL